MNQKVWKSLLKFKFEIKTENKRFCLSLLAADSPAVIGSCQRQRVDAILSKITKKTAKKVIIIQFFDSMYTISIHVHKKG